MIFKRILTSGKQLHVNVSCYTFHSPFLYFMRRFILIYNLKLFKLLPTILLVFFKCKTSKKMDMTLLYSRQFQKCVSMNRIPFLLDVFV